MNPLRPCLLLVTLALAACVPSSSGSGGGDTVVLIDDTPDAADAGADAVDVGAPDASPDAAPDVATEDAEVDAAPPRRTLSIVFEGDGEVEVELFRDISPRQTCSSDCAITFEPTGFNPFEVRVFETRAGGAFVGFDGPCGDPDDPLECDVADTRDVTLTVRTRDYDEPDGQAVWLAARGEGVVYGAALDADGDAHLVVDDVSRQLVPGASAGRTYLELSRDREVKRSVALPSSRTYRVLVDPTTGDPWVFLQCGRNADLGGFRMPDQGPCAARISSAGELVDGVGWPGVDLDDAAVGADGTFAFTGGARGDVTLGPHLLEATERSDEYTQYVARFDPATGDLPWARTITRYRWDLESGVAVGPTGEVYVLGSLIGERTLFGLAFDTSNFLTQAYLVKLDAAGEVDGVRQLGGTGGSFAKSLTASGSRLFVGMSYNGFLEAGNGVVSEEARGLNQIGTLLVYDADLNLERFKYLSRSTDPDQLVAAPDGGVYVGSGFFTRGAWDLTSSGYMVSRDASTSSSGLARVGVNNQLAWMSALAKGVGSLMSNGDHLAVAGAYRRDLLMGSGPAGSSSASTAFIMWLDE
jgi:hypothetical protein